MFADLENYNYELMNPPDWAHNLSRLFVWICKVLVGPNGEGYASDAAKTVGSDSSHRVQAQRHGIFPDIWPDRPIYLERDLANMLRGTSYTLVHTLTTTYLHIQHPPTQQISQLKVFKRQHHDGAKSGGRPAEKRCPRVPVLRLYARRFWSGKMY